MKQEAAFFDGKEPVLIYIAKRLRDALKLETLLTEASLDYGVEADEYRGGIIFATTRTGRSSTCCRTPNPPRSKSCAAVATSRTPAQRGGRFRLPTVREFEWARGVGKRKRLPHLA